MIKYILSLTSLLTMLAFESDEPVNKLNGAFRQTKNKYGSMTEWKTRDSVTVIKVFRDGYWFGAFYDDKRRDRYDEKTAGIKPFDGACGGTYELKNGKYIEKIGFYSWDSTAVGNVFSFDYKISDQHYEQFGVMNSEKYPNYPINEVAERIKSTEPLKNAGLEGVWFMKEGQWGGADRLGEGKYKNMQVVKIFSYPMVVYAYYNPITRRFDGAGGAMYQFDGKTLTETNEFWSWQADGKRKGNAETFKISLDNGRYVQQGWDGKLKEVFTKAN
ncbi:hypothetical protein G8759_12710 [Spirosoma aureum]|uniref:Uncharacterized protein n=1 Tax=Spirosoma aureum TaxID=2692134 RepID=A0A6G9ALY7_9BACT|nr:hypothetical protein [Spirosoma aureum]QIP13428.1 hypothetical protein G8759_12710 [Spirosoma aureum]